VANLRARQKEMTRKLLLKTALELFESKGYAATTVDDIASAAGTTRVTFYAHFPSRTDQMLALFGELNELLERTSSAERGTTSGELVAVVRDGTREGITGWLRESAGRWPRIQPYLNAAREAAMNDPEIRVLVDQWWDEAYADIVDGLEQAGRFDPASRRVRAELAFVQLDHIAGRWTRRDWTADREQALELLIETWTHLLGEG
jgi:AcrR family transcriptional regulator